jgi:hypothetical protein
MAFVTFDNLEEVINATLEEWLPAFNYNPFKQVVFMKFMAAKLVAYSESLAESNPEDENLPLLASASNLFFENLEDTYDTPKENEMFAEGANAFDAIINEFISEKSDSAEVDLIFIGALLNVISQQHLSNWSDYCEKRTDGFNALKTAKKTSSLVALVTHHIAQV